MQDAGTYDKASKTGGLNASVRFEFDRPENFGLKRGFGPIIKAHDLLKNTVAKDISFSDLIACGGAYAVSLTGGPSITVPLGRLDADTADPEGRLPAETLTPSELKAHFAKGGFDAQELVVLSGAHTVGGKGFGEPLSFDNTYFKTLLERPWNASGSKMDVEMAQMIGLPSDKALPDDEECYSWIELYASDQDRFFKDFESAYLKLVDTGAAYA